MQRCQLGRVPQRCVHRGSAEAHARPVLVQDEQRGEKSEIDATIMFLAWFKDINNE